MGHDERGVKERHVTQAEAAAAEWTLVGDAEAYQIEASNSHGDFFLLNANPLMQLRFEFFS